MYSLPGIFILNLVAAKLGAATNLIFLVFGFLSFE